MNLERSWSEEQITKRMVELYNEFVAKNKNINLQKDEGEKSANKQNRNSLSEIDKIEIFVNPNFKNRKF